MPITHTSRERSLHADCTLTIKYLITFEILSADIYVFYAVLRNDNRTVFEDMTPWYTGMKTAF